MTANINIQKCSASEIIFKLDTAESIENFLLDVLTPQEKKVLDMRWHIAQLLHMGKFSYAEIAKQLNTSC